VIKVGSVAARASATQLFRPLYSSAMIVRIYVTIYFKRLICPTAWSMSRTNKTFDMADRRTCLQRPGPAVLPIPGPSRRRDSGRDADASRGEPRLVNFCALSENLERRLTRRAGRGDGRVWAHGGEL